MSMFIHAYSYFSNLFKLQIFCHPMLPGFKSTSYACNVKVLYEITPLLLTAFSQSLVYDFTCCLTGSEIWAPFILQQATVTATENLGSSNSVYTCFIFSQHWRVYKTEIHTGKGAIIDRNTCHITNNWSKILKMKSSSVKFYQQYKIK